MDEAREDRVASLGTVNFLLGIWLIISPYLLNYTSSTAKWNQTIIGVVVAILAAFRMMAPRQAWASFTVGLIGIWAIIAPFILDYDRAVAYWNEVLVGLAIAIIAFWNSSILPTDRRQHHTTI